MSVPAQHAYPANATNKVWQSKKSVGDKILTTTGLGPKLTEKIVAYRDENGPFASRAEANAMSQKLLGDGYNAVVLP